MAVAYDAETTCNDASASALSWTHTPSGTPTDVIVGTGSFDFPAAFPTSVTYGGTGMTRVDGQVAGGDFVQSSTYVLGSPASGAQTVTVNRGGTPFNIDAGAITVTGGAGTGASASNSGTGTGTDASSGAVTSASNDLVIDTVLYGDTAAQTVPGGQTASWNASNGVRTTASYAAGASPNVTMTRTHGASVRWVSSAVNIPAASAGTRPVKMAGVWGGFAGESGGFAGGDTSEIFASATRSTRSSRLVR